MEYCENGDLRQYVENMKKSGTEISDKVWLIEKIIL